MQKLFVLWAFFLAVAACSPLMAQMPIMVYGAQQSAPAQPQQGAKQPAAAANTAASNASAPEGADAQISTKQPPAQSLGIFESATAERMTDRVFDVNKDSFDLENGLLKWKGRTFSIGDSRLVRARFEKYLSTPVDLRNFESYQGIINEIMAQLAASNDRLTIEQLRIPWSRLFDAAEYDIDGGSSITIANLVYLSWRMRDEFSNQKELVVEQSRIVDEQRKLFVGASSFLEFANDKVKTANAKNNAQQRTEGTAEIAMLSTQLAEEVTALAAQKANATAIGAKAVFQFQSHVLSFLLERKFQQAQIASMFYRHIYRGNAHELKVGAENINSFMDVKNYVPTIDMLEMLATEARKDIRDGMSAVSKLYDSGERYSALQRLMETFALGEFEPALQVFDDKKKEVLKEIYKKTSTIKELADNKDWTGIEDLVSDIKKIAKDFPEREILSKVRAAKQASNMYLMAAKQAAAMGKNEEVRDSMASAMKIWPLNPALETLNAELLGMATGASLYTRKFDDNVSRGNFRNIVSEAPEYGLAFRNDPDRASSLRDIIVRISKVDALIAQAEEFVKQGNVYFAWDILDNALKIEPGDPLLALSRSRLAPEVADYVKTVSRARQAESDKKYAAALNLYIAAQEIFPASQICRQGIERLAPLYDK